jgi:hypothetical protein
MRGSDVAAYVLPNEERLANVNWLAVHPTVGGQAWGLGMTTSITAPF